MKIGYHFEEVMTPGASFLAITVYIDGKPTEEISIVSLEEDD